MKIPLYTSNNLRDVMISWSVRALNMRPTICLESTIRNSYSRQS